MRTESSFGKDGFEVLGDLELLYDLADLTTDLATRQMQRKGNGFENLSADGVVEEWPALGSIGRDQPEARPSGRGDD